MIPITSYMREVVRSSDGFAVEGRVRRRAPEIAVATRDGPGSADASRREFSVGMGVQDGPAIASVEFEVFGQVQGVYFTKYCRDMSLQLGLGGWVKNSRNGTIVGKVQGNKSNVEQMAQWLSKTGSPGCKIESCDFRNWEFLSRQDFRGFSIRF